MSKLPAPSVSKPCDYRILQSPHKRTSETCSFGDRATVSIYKGTLKIDQITYKKRDCVKNNVVPFFLALLLLSENRRHELFQDFT